VVAEDGVALTTQTYAEQLGRVLAEAARGEPVVEELWVSTRPDGVDLWLVTQRIDPGVEHELHGLADVLYERFDGADFLVYVVNPCHFGGDVHQVLPRHAVQIPMRVT
jgi:hypothetical protein